MRRLVVMNFRQHTTRFSLLDAAAQVLLRGVHLGILRHDIIVLVLVRRAVLEI